MEAIDPSVKPGIFRKEAPPEKGAQDSEKSDPDAEYHLALEVTFVWDHNNSRMHA